MRKLLGLVFLITSLVLTGCLKSQPSNLAIEVMSKRYWQDQLAMVDHFPVEKVRVVSQFHEAADRYIAVVEYQVISQVGEAQIIELIQQADALEQRSPFDQVAVRHAIEQLPNRFLAQQSMTFTKTLAFADGSRGWLLEQEVSRP